MVQLDIKSQHANDDDTSTLSIILLMMSLVVTVIGIKLKWFRHRLTFAQPENEIESPVLLRTTSVTEFRENCARGVYRQSDDAESLIMRESFQKPVTNGKAKAKKNSDRQSIFRMPFKSKLNLSKFPSRDDSKISTVQPLASVHPPSREKDVATLVKNENLKRMIHESLSRNSLSMPNLVNHEDPSFRRNEERSVDETDRIHVLNESEKVEQQYSPLSESSVENVIQVPLETVQKKVKFEEVVEMKEIRVLERKVLAQVENNFIESSNQESYDSEIFVLELSPDLNSEVMPPTPMKRKSREEYFEISNVQEIDSLHDNEITLEVPVVKPRTKRLIHRTSEEVQPKIDSETFQEVVILPSEHPEKLERHEVEVSQLSEAIPKSILKSSETSSSPKTLRFNSLTHTISDNDDDDASTSCTSSSESEVESEGDVWSQVDQHRKLMLNRQKEVPPPLPKTPPPSAEEEESKLQFSFA